MCRSGEEDPGIRGHRRQNLFGATGNEETIRFLQGRLEVADSRATAAQCVGTTLSEGSYVLPLRGAEPGLRAWVPQDETADSGSPTGDQAEAVPLYGPFASIQQYCADLPDFGVWPAPMDTGDDDPLKPRHRAEACAASPSGWSLALAARGPIGGVSLVGVRNEMAGATIHHCRIALRTARGWFVTTDYETCQGVVGPGASTETRVLPLRWLGQAEPSVVLVSAVGYQSFDS